MKYSGSDFKFTSQANPFVKIVKCEIGSCASQLTHSVCISAENLMLDGTVSSNWSCLIESALDD